MFFKFDYCIILISIFPIIGTSIVEYGLHSNESLQLSIKCRGVKSTMFAFGIYEVKV